MAIAGDPQLVDTDLDSPVMIEPDAVDDKAPLAWTTVALAVAALFLAVFNAPVIGEWLDDLPQNQIVEALRPKVEFWQSATARMNAPRALLHGRWNAVRTLRFGREKSGEEGVDDAP